MTRAGGFILGTWIEFIGGDIFLLSCVLIESLIFKTPLFRFSRRPAWWELTPGSMGFIFVVRPPCAAALLALSRCGAWRDCMARTFGVSADAAAARFARSHQR